MADPTPPLNTARRELALLKSLLPAPPPTPALDLVVQRPRVGIGCLLTCAAHPGALLVGARRGSHGAGRWALPGGHLERDHAFQDTASAELAEECGVALAPSRWSPAPILVTNNVMPAEDLHYITLFLHAELTREEAAQVLNVEEHKCEGWQWLTPAALHSLPLFLPLQHLLAAPPALLEPLLGGGKEHRIADK
jgi:8-oxo-dGTP diphosphatase